MTEKAIRLNAGKVEFTRIPVDAQIEEARVWMAGAVKYPDNADGTPNWTHLWGDHTIHVCLNSLLRHALAIQQGESVDPETGLLHAAAIRCNAAMIIRYQLQIRKEPASNDI